MRHSTNLQDIALGVSELEQKLTRTQARLNGWIRGNETNPSFEFLRVDQAEFYYPPVETARWRRNDSSQIITANTWQTIVWDEESWNFLPFQYSTASTGIIRQIGTRFPAVILFAGAISWRNNSSGERLLRFNVLTTSGQKSYKVSDAPPIGSLEVVDNFVFAYSMDEKSSGFNFQVWQNGDATLPVIFAYMGAMLLSREEKADSTKTLVISPPTQDAYVQGDSTENNQTPSSYIVTADSSSAGGGSRHYRAFLQFDLSGIPIDKNILSADLEMLVSDRTNNTSFVGALDIQRVTTAWLSSVITGANQPPVSGSMGSTGENGGSTWVGWALSTVEFKNMMSSNFGMRVSYTDETAQGSTNADSHNFYAAAAEPFFDKRPRLIVRWIE